MPAIKPDAIYSLSAGLAGSVRQEGVDVLGTVVREGSGVCTESLRQLAVELGLQHEKYVSDPLSQIFGRQVGWCWRMTLFGTSSLRRSFFGYLFEFGAMGTFHMQV